MLPALWSRRRCGRRSAHPSLQLRRSVGKDRRPAVGLRFEPGGRHPLTAGHRVRDCERVGLLHGPFVIDGYWQGPLVSELERRAAGQCRQHAGTVRRLVTQSNYGCGTWRLHSDPNKSARQAATDHVRADVVAIEHMRACHSSAASANTRRARFQAGWPSSADCRAASSSTCRISLSSKSSATHQS